MNNNDVQRKNEANIRKRQTELTRFLIQIVECVRENSGLKAVTVVGSRRADGRRQSHLTDLRGVKKPSVRVCCTRARTGSSNTLGVGWRDHHYYGRGKCTYYVNVRTRTAAVSCICMLFPIYNAPICMRYRDLGYGPRAGPWCENNV